MEKLVERVDFGVREDALDSLVDWALFAGAREGQTVRVSYDCTCGATPRR